MISGFQTSQLASKNLHNSTQHSLLNRLGVLSSYRNHALLLKTSSFPSRSTDGPCQLPTGTKMLRSGLGGGFMEHRRTNNKRTSIYHSLDSAPSLERGLPTWKERVQYWWGTGKGPDTVRNYTWAPGSYTRTGGLRTPIVRRWPPLPARQGRALEPPGEAPGARSWLYLQSCQWLPPLAQVRLDGCA